MKNRRGTPDGLPRSSRARHERTGAAKGGINFKFYLGRRANFERPRLRARLGRQRPGLCQTDSSRSWIERTNRGGMKMLLFWSNGDFTEAFAIGRPKPFRGAGRSRSACRAATWSSARNSLARCAPSSGGESHAAGLSRARPRWAPGSAVRIARTPAVRRNGRIAVIAAEAAGAALVTLRMRGRQVGHAGYDEMMGSACAIGPFRLALRADIPPAPVI
jgi:hypothetical protein